MRAGDGHLMQLGAAEILRLRATGLSEHPMVEAKQNADDCVRTLVGHRTSWQKAATRLLCPAADGQS